MDLLILAYNNGIQNVHAPLPLPAHLIFCALATLLYTVQFQRKRLKHYIYLLVAIDLTLLTQFYDQSYVVIAIGIAEILLLVLTFVSMHRNKKELKRLELEKENQELEKKGEEDAKALTVKINKVKSDDIEDDSED